MLATGSRTLAQTAGGRGKGVRWDPVKAVQSMIKKEGKKTTSEKRWVCSFCEKPFQGGPSVNSGTPRGARNSEEDASEGLQ